MGVARPRLPCSRHRGGWMLPREVDRGPSCRADGPAELGALVRPACRGEAAELGAGERAKHVRGGESVGQPQGAEAGPQLHPLRLRSAGSSVGSRPNRARDWPPGPARHWEWLGETACMHGAQGGPSPPRALPLLQREARAFQVPCLPLLRVSCSPRQSCFPSSPPAAWGVEEGRPGEHCTACTPAGAHMCTDTPVLLMPLHLCPWGHRQGAGPRALMRPRATPSGAELWGPRPDGASGTLAGPP